MWGREMEIWCNEWKIRMRGWDEKGRCLGTGWQVQCVPVCVCGCGSVGTRMTWVPRRRCGRVGAWEHDTRCLRRPIVSIQWLLFKSKSINKNSPVLPLQQENNFIFPTYSALVFEVYFTHSGIHRNVENILHFQSIVWQIYERKIK